MRHKTIAIMLLCTMLVLALYPLPTSALADETANGQGTVASGGREENGDSESVEQEGSSTKEEEDPANGIPQADTQAPSNEKGSSEKTDATIPEESLGDSADMSDGTGPDASTNDPNTEANPFALNQSAYIPDGYYRISPLGNSSMSLGTSTSGGNGAPIQLNNANDSDAQVWHITSNGEESGYTIQNVQTGLVLDVPSGLAKSGTRLQLYDSNNTNAQHWSIIANDDGSYTFVSALSIDLVIDLPAGSTQSGTRIQLYSSNSTTAQKWTIAKTQTSRQKLDDLAAQNAETVQNGTYVLKSGVSTNKVLSIASSSSADGANAQINISNGSASQQWIIAHDDQGYLSIQNKGTGKMLDVASGVAQSGSNVQQYSSNNTFAQKWIAISTDSGLKLVSGLNASLVLDVSSGLNANGANVQIWESNDSIAQRWTLEGENAAFENLDALAATYKNTLPEGTYYIQSLLKDRKVLDVSSGSKADGSNVQLYDANLTGAQQWTVTYGDDGYATITNKNSGKVLDVSAGLATPGTNVQQYGSNGSRAQKWIIEPVNKDGRAAYRLRSALGEGISLDIASGSTQNGANAQLYEDNATAAQMFTFIGISPDVAPCEDILPSGWFNLAASSNSNFVIDIDAGSKSDGANAQLYASNGTHAQLFRFEYHDGYYLIINAQSGKALDVDGGSPFPLTNVHQWSASASNNNQLFSVEANSDGTYTFTNKATGLALDINGNAMANGANIDVYTPNGSNAQKFILTARHDFVSPGVYTIALKDSNKRIEASQNSDSNIVLNGASDSFAQKWYISLLDKTNGTYLIESIDSGKRLTATSDGVQLQSAIEGTSQQWRLELSDGGALSIVSAQNGKALQGTGSNQVGLTDFEHLGNQMLTFSTTDVFIPGTYVIKSNANSSQAIDITSGLSSNGANIQTWENNGSSAQIWDIWKNADGTYLIKNADNGKSLDITNGAITPGNNIQLYQKNGSSAQKWNISYEAGSGFKISPASNSRLSLGATSDSVASGTNIALVDDAPKANYRFSFVPTTFTPSIFNEVQWKGARFYSSGRQGNDWNALVIHISECTSLQQIANTFWGTREASAHYGVGSNGIHQYVNLNDTAWAVGNWQWNLRTVSIEHVGTTNNPPTRATLDKSAQLMAALARQKGWTELVMGSNVGIHKWYGNTSCPASLDVHYLVSKANEYMGNGFTYKEVSSGWATPRSNLALSEESTTSLRDALSRSSLVGAQ